MYNLCAGFQLAVARHLCHRTQRAMEYIKLKHLLPEDNLTLVPSHIYSLYYIRPYSYPPLILKQYFVNWEPSIVTILIEGSQLIKCNSVFILFNDDTHWQVMSGGSACNNFIMKALNLVCDSYGYQLVRPPPKLCTDNGVMIAWNGVEK